MNVLPTSRTGIVRPLIIILLLLALPAHGAAERDPVPPPPGGGPGVTHLPGDGLPPGTPATAKPMSVPTPPAREGEVPIASAGGDKNGGTLGGDDNIFMSEAGVFSSFPRTAYDSAGNGYFARTITSGGVNQVQVHRSTDGGLTWPLWASYTDPDPDVSYYGETMIVAEGALDRCFFATTRYAPGDEVTVVFAADLAAAAPAALTPVIALAVAGETVIIPCLASDAGSFSSYYLYLVAESRTATTSKIVFARSIDQGASWESAYAIGQVFGAGIHYTRPRVTYGYGSRVHVAWYYHSDTLVGQAVRYRGADSFANGGLPSWGTLTPLSSTADDQEISSIHIAAAGNGDEVLIVAPYQQVYANYHDRVWSSDDRGATWPVDLDDPFTGEVRGLVWQPTTDRWVANLFGYGTQIVSASVTAPSVWNQDGYFYDGGYSITSANCYPSALNPAESHRIGAFWSYGLDDDSDIRIHDAEWFTDPGWPDEEVGSPVPLDMEAVTAPALSDLDGDSDLEIIFTSGNDEIVALHHDGTPVAGWPVEPGPPLVPSPVAVGDINGDDRVEIAVGTKGGLVYLFRADGTVVPGWPVATIDPQPAHVSMGVLGPPYHRVVVACAGYHAETFNFSGVHPNGYISPGTTEALMHPAAIGDVDGDGTNELVIAGTKWVAGYHPAASSPAFAETLPDTISDAPTLGDMDSDGDVEICVPTVPGRMYALHGDGSPVTGWPFDTGRGYALSSAAIANCRGGGTPEIVFASRDTTVFMLTAAGTVYSGYPTHTGESWWILADPVVTPLVGSADVIIGSRARAVYSWDNFGQVNDGWPRALPDQVHLAAAAGDVDLDGNLEVVVLDRSNMRVFDVNEPPYGGSSWSWPMQGHDSRRTGCWECPEDLVTPVPGEVPGLTRVEFALETADPTADRVILRYALPDRAVVTVDVFDVRGRLVRRVERAELPAGEYRTTWDGRDGRGRSIASGVYLARLQVRGPRLDENMVRKVLRVR